MRRIALVAAACAALIAATPASSSPAIPDRVMARGSEFDILLSKAKVKPGRVIVQFVNAGEDPHDLQLQRVGQGVQTGAGVTPPGEAVNIDTRLKKHATYVLYCSLSDHRERGMEATLRTRKHRR